MAPSKNVPIADLRGLFVLRSEEKESSGGMSARKKRWGENTIAVLPGSVTVDSNKVTACK